MMLDRVPNEALIAAGLELMKQAGNPLTKVPSRGRAMIYETRDGKTVRMRTSNDHVLIVVADKDASDAKLNVEGTDHVLIVMPVVPRSHGPAIGYFVPASEVAEAARTSHKNWLDSNPNTRGDNKTWNLWFNSEGPAKANGFAKTWEKYRLQGAASTSIEASSFPPNSPNPPKLVDVINAAKKQIAEAAGITPEQVKITIEVP